MQIVSHLIMKEGQAYLERKPHLKAEMVARMYVDGTHSIEEVAAHYGLTVGEVHAALAYYYDNQAELDAQYKRVLTEIRENAMTLEKFKAKIAAKGNRADE